MFKKHNRNILLSKVVAFKNLYRAIFSGPVCFYRPDLIGLQPLKDISPLRYEEMSLNNENKIRDWLNIINQSFKRNWEKKNFIQNIVEHRIYDVTHTYFLLYKDSCIGVVSEAVYKKNKNVGVTHYLGLDKKYTGKGLGKQLILYTLHKMKEHNIKACEGETTLSHKKSIFLHFDLGFYPKTRLNYWNTSNDAPMLMEAIVRYKFNRLYKKWKIEKTE